MRGHKSGPTTINQPKQVIHQRLTKVVLKTDWVEI